MELGINPDELAAIFDMLRDNGVEEFECKGFHVRFASSSSGALLPISKESSEFADPHRAEKASEIKDLWHSETLWGTSGPPKFPGSK